MKTNKLFHYYLNKGDKKSAMRIKNAFYRQQLPHERDIRRKRKINILFDNLREYTKNK